MDHLQVTRFAPENTPQYKNWTVQFSSAREFFFSRSHGLPLLAALALTAAACAFVGGGGGTLRKPVCFVTDIYLSGILMSLRKRHLPYRQVRYFTGVDQCVIQENTIL